MKIAKQEERIEKGKGLSGPFLFVKSEYVERGNEKLSTLHAQPLLSHRAGDLSLFAGRRKPLLEKGLPGAKEGFLRPAPDPPAGREWSPRTRLHSLATTGAGPTQQGRWVRPNGLVFPLGERHPQNPPGRRAGYAY